MINKISLLTIGAIILVFTGCKKDNEADKYHVDSAPVWQVDDSKYEYSMQIIGTLSYNNFVFENENDMLGAFIGNECVGFTKSVFVESTNQCVLMLSFFGNSSGDIITFKMYDALNSRLIDADNTVSFAPSGLQGSISEPLIISKNE